MCSVLQECFICISMCGPSVRPLPPRAIFPVRLKVFKCFTMRRSGRFLVCLSSADGLCHSHRRTIRASFSAAFNQDAAKLWLPAERCNHLPCCISQRPCCLAQLTEEEAACPACIPQATETILVWMFRKQRTHISKITGCRMNACCVWKEGKMRAQSKSHKEKHNPCTSQLWRSKQVKFFSGGYKLY